MPTIAVFEDEIDFAVFYVRSKVWNTYFSVAKMYGWYDTINVATCWFIALDDLATSTEFSRPLLTTRGHSYIATSSRIVKVLYLFKALHLDYHVGIT